MEPTTQTEIETPKRKAKNGTTKQRPGKRNLADKVQRLSADQIGAMHADLTNQLNVLRAEAQRRVESDGEILKKIAAD